MNKNHIKHKWYLITEVELYYISPLTPNGFIHLSSSIWMQKTLLINYGKHKTETAILHFCHHSLTDVHENCHYITFNKLKCFITRTHKMIFALILIYQIKIHISVRILRKCLHSQITLFHSAESIPKCIFIFEVLFSTGLD